MTLWIEWAIIDGDRIAFYIWNNLPDPTGTGKRFGFPNTTFLQYGGDGKFGSRPTTTTRPTPRGCSASGSPTAASATRRRTARCRASTAGPPRRPRPRSRARRSRPSSRSTASAPSLAVATGDWDQWADQFTDDAHYREHHYGYFTSGSRDPGVDQAVMQPFPTMEFPPSFSLIDGNRVSALIPNILPAPDGDDGYYGFDVNTILHYAGNGKWSYEEDVYSPARPRTPSSAGSRPAGSSRLPDLEHRTPRRARQVRPRRPRRPSGTLGGRRAPARALWALAAHGRRRASSSPRVPSPVCPASGSPT